LDELMKAKWVTTADSKKESAAPSVLRFTNYQNRLALWLAWLVVKERRQKKRIKRISFILCIAKELMELNNFNSSMTVYLALTLSPVRRLVATWANLPKPSTQIWQNVLLYNLVSQIFANYSFFSFEAPRAHVSEEQLLALSQKPSGVHRWRRPSHPYPRHALSLPLSLFVAYCLFVFVRDYS